MLAPLRLVLRGERSVAYTFVESPNATPANGRPVDVVVMHTMEIAERPDAAEICARWFASRASQVSAHYCVDAGTVIQCVREKDIAWHARGGNGASIGVELAGFASQTRRDWHDEYSNAVLGRAAALVADVCRRRRIPVRWLVADDLRAGRHGLTGHVEVSRAFGKSDHWDPGDGFPVEAFVDHVRRLQQAQRHAKRASRARL
jgi:N-acetyl-anhydromuramyl-L-alanine amidase AmpD